MKHLLTSIAVLALLILPQAAQAQLDTNQLAKVSEIFVTVDDGVRHGCLPSPNVLKVEAELILRRSGIRVFDDNDGFRHQLLIAINGSELTEDPDHRPSGGCIAATHIELGRFEPLADGTFGYVTATGTVNSYFGHKDGLQNQLRENINEAVTALANEILKARAK